MNLINEKTFNILIALLLAMLVIPNVVSAASLSHLRISEYGELIWDKVEEDLPFGVKVSQGTGDFYDVETSIYSYRDTNDSTYIARGTISGMITNYCKEHECSLSNNDFGIMVYYGDSDNPTYFGVEYYKAYYVEYVDVDLSIDRNTLTKTYYSDTEIEKNKIADEWVVSGDTASGVYSDDIPNLHGSDYVFDNFTVYRVSEYGYGDIYDANYFEVKTNTTVFANWHKKYLSLSFVNTRGVSLDNNEGAIEGYNPDNYFTNLSVYPNGDYAFYDSESVARVKLYNFSRITNIDEDVDGEYFYDCLYHNDQKYWQAGECKVNDYSNDPEAFDAFDYGWNHTNDPVKVGDNFNGIWVKPKPNLQAGIYFAVIAIELYDDETKTWKTTHATEVNFDVYSSITYDYNGATNSSGQGYETKYFFPNGSIDTTREQLLSGLTLPESKDLDYLLVNGQRVELGSNVDVYSSKTIKYMWKTISAVQVDPTPTTPTTPVTPTTPIVNPTISVEKGPGSTLYINWQFQPSAVRYEVYRSTDKKKWTKYDSTDGSSYEQLGLTYGKTYYYKVKACDATKCSDYSNVASKKVVPDKVENVRVTGVGQKNIKISWNKVSVTGYEVYMNGKKITTIKKNGTLSYNKKKLKVNKTYSFKVRAYKTVKGKKVYGAFSETIYVRTAPATPKKPGISLNDYNALNISVKGVGGAARYEIVRSTSKKGTYIKVGELTSAGTYVDSSLTTGTTYYYKVRACNSDNNCGAYTSIVSKKVVPKTPGISVVSPETKKVVVTTTAVNGVDGYEVFRSTKKKKGYKKQGEITDLGNLVFENATSAKKTYYYKVRAYKIVNGNKIYSAYSGIKKIKSN